MAKVQPFAYPLRLSDDLMQKLKVVSEENGRSVNKEIEIIVLSHFKRSMIMTSNRKTFTLRVDETLLEKLHYVSKKNKRSANNQIEVLLEEFIENFENKNGEIKTNLED